MLDTEIPDYRTQSWGSRVVVPAEPTASHGAGLSPFSSCLLFLLSVCGAKLPFTLCL